MRKYSVFPVLVFLAALVSACSVSPWVEATATPAPSPTATAVPATATPVPVQLTVCLGEEPQSLFLYSGESSAAKRSVLQAVYDGPIDLVDYLPQPVILDPLPDLGTGGAELRPVAVSEGMSLVDADGNLRTLHKGVPVVPAGCAAPDCVLAYDGSGSVTLDQLVVRFRLKPGLTWSDGTPLTAADSVYSFELAGSPDIPASKAVIQRTASYRALDDLTVEWTGLPGYLDPGYQSRFWLPLPRHLLADRSPQEILADPAVRTKPVGWGPFVIREWVPGDHITAERNPAYFRAAEGLPGVDLLTFRFLGTDAQAGIAALQDGRCDVLDPSLQLEGSLSALQGLADSGPVRLLTAASPALELLSLGVKPSAYDEAYGPTRGDRPDLLGDPNVRRAIAACIDREALNRELLAGSSAAPPAFLPLGDPGADPALPVPAYDPGEGAQLLQAAGWQDDDGDPATPRVAYTAAQVPPGTRLVLDLVTAASPLQQDAAGRIAANLSECGVEVKVEALPPEELFAPGPEGPVFGRSFDLALFSWGEVSSACQLFTSSQVPTRLNGWIGANVTGYSSAGYDAACLAARLALPGQPGFIAAQHLPQAAFSADLPAIPLYQGVRIAAARKAVCGLQLDATTGSLLYNVETLTISGACP